MLTCFLNLSDVRPLECQRHLCQCLPTTQFFLHEGYSKSNTFKKKIIFANFQTSFGQAIKNCLSPLSNESRISDCDVFTQNISFPFLLFLSFFNSSFPSQLFYFSKFFVFLCCSRRIILTSVYWVLFCLEISIVL